MRDIMNRGRRMAFLPNLEGAAVQFVKAEPHKRTAGMLVVTITINGWPHDFGMWAKDELDAMKNVFAMQRGEKPMNVFDISQ